MVRRTVLVEIKTIGRENVRQASNEVTRLGRNAQLTTSSLGSLSTVANAVITSLAVRRLAEYADAWTNIQNRLRQVTTDTQDLANTTEDLFVIAQNSRAGLQSIAQLYFRISQSASEFGASQEQVIGITESLANQLAVAGLTAGEVNSVLLQTSQAFNRGRLNGDEFRAISEALPSVLRAVAREMGVTRDQLNDLSEQGEITNRVLANALINTLDSSRQTLETTSVTISQTTTRISNSLTRLIGTLDNTLGATIAVQNGASFLIDTLDNLNAVVGTGLISDLAAQQFAGINSDIRETIRILGILPEAANESGNAVTTFLGGAFQNLVPNIRAFIQILTVEIASFLDKTSAAFSFVFSNIAEGNFEALLQEGQGPLAQLEQVRQESIAGILRQRDAEVAATEAIIAQVRARIAAYQEEAAARTGRVLSNQPGEVEPAEGGAPLDSNDKQFVDRLRQRLLQEEHLIAVSVQNQQRIRDGGIIEQEAREQESFIRRVQQLDIQRQMLIDRIGQDQAMQLGLLQNFANLEEQIVAQSQQRIAQIRQQSARQQTQAVLSSFAQIQQLNQRSLGLQRVAIVANTASAVIQSYNNAGGYPYGLIPAGIMAAIGVKQLSQVGKSSFSGGAAPSGGAASPGLTQPTLSQDPFVTTESFQANEILNILNNQDPTQLYTSEQLRTIVSSIAALENAGQL